MPPDQAAPPEESPKPRRRWKRWLFGCLLVIAAFLFWFNGHGVRLVAKKVILIQLEAQKLTGTFQISGTALHGLSIRDLALTGESKIQSVTSDLVKLTWSPSSLLEKRIDSLSLEKLHIVIDPKAPPLPKKDAPSKEKKPLPEALDLIRTLVRPTDIALSDLRLEIIDRSTFTIDSFTHSPYSDDYILSYLCTQDHLNRDICSPSTTITWGPAGFDLDHIALLSNFSLQNITFHPEKKASAQVFIDGKKISLSSDLQTKHRITLDSGPLNIRTLAEIINPSLLANKNVQGLITDLEVDTSQGLINFQATDLQWEKQKLTFASVEARTPDLLSPFDQAVTVKVQLEDRLSILGTVTPSPQALDSTADLTFTLRDPAIPTITGHLNYQTREVQVTASALSDLKVQASYFVDSSTYQAQAQAALPDASQLDPKLHGPLTFSLTGKGDLKAKTHSGTLDLDQLQLKTAPLDQATSEAIITYDWPQKVTITKLKTSSPEGQLQADLEWQNDILTLSKLDIFEGDQKLLSATAQLPAPLKKQSLDDLLNSTDPIKLNLQSQPLSLQTLSSFIPIPPELSGVFLADLTLTGSLAQPTLNGFANLDGFRLASQPDLPPIDLDLKLRTEDQTLFLKALSSEPNGPLLNLDADLPFTPRIWIESKTKPEELPLNVHLHSPKLDLQRLKNSPSLPDQLAGILEADLTLTGSLAQPSFNGFLTLASFRLQSQPGIPTLDLDLNFKTEKEKLLLTAQAREPNGLLFNLNGSLPFLPQVWLQKKKHPAGTPIDLRISAPQLNLRQFKNTPGLPEEIDGTLQTDLTLSGTLSEPSLDGFLTLSSFRLQNQPNLSPVDFQLKLRTEKQELLLTADASDPNGSLFDVTGKLPFLPKAWIERKKNPSDNPINLRATSPDLDLRRIQPFVPTIKQITGDAKLDLLITGTISQPQISGSAKARIQTMRLAKSPMSTFRDTEFNATFKDDTITILPSTIGASGGTAQVSGTITIGGAEPVFDIGLAGRHVLLHRSADYTFRGHPKLKVTGPFSKAKISGSVAITESLFYKDLEILPFGVPRTTDIPQPKLPSFSLKKNTTTTATDTGIMAWELDIDVTTADPILIRGNLARGEITGEVKVTGSIGDPKTSGTLRSKDLHADLPFSDLEVQSSLITLRPESLTNPLIDLRGSSTIGQYTVQVYLTGPVQKPTLILTSDPPLPESEIMLLLATGSASAQLEDRQVASQKALQYLIEGLRRRNRGKDKSLFQRLLKNSDQIELSLGDTNQFSGRKFSSATLELDDQWDFTTQIDEFGQTRALVIFSVRLK